MYVVEPAGAMEKERAESFPAFAKFQYKP